MRLAMRPASFAGTSSMPAVFNLAARLFDVTVVALVFVAFS
ncbi:MULTISPECIES: hypothetical protein [unclassified Brevundimonas]